ncbi:MAG: leucine-rich repeat domain-containing protein, partial [Paludibacteraceae bacterium]|nr:leucine-rich repeat domain-containing protein [Paludibacteraceae bacterium]
IPNSITSIGEYAFSGCDFLSIIIPENVTSINNYSFASCKSLTDIYVHATTPPLLSRVAFTYITPPTCYIPCGTLEAYEASDWAEQVGEFVEECENVLPDSTHCIFYTSTDGNIVEPRETDVFGANIVTNTYENGQGIITFDGPVTSIGERAFSQCKTLTTIILPTSVNNIGLQAFMFCEELKEISIPENVTTIGEGAFHFCQALTSVELSKSLNIIEKSAFQVCTALTSISVPDSVTFIGNRAFCNCQSLSLVTIGSGMTMIDEAAFMASPVANLHMKSVIPPTFIADSYPLFDSSPTCYIPCGTLEAYEASDWAEQVGEFVEECENVLPDSTHYIYYTSSTGKIVTPYKTDVFGANIISNTYENGQGVITFDGPVTTIGDSAFLQCEKLNTITLPNSVTSIGNRTFKDCTLLHSIIIPNSVMSIGEYAFQFCIYLSSINMPNRMHNIGNGAFRYCRSLSTIIIPDGIDAIADAVFDGCYLLSSITIPNGVKTIGVQAFRDCESLSEFIMGDDVTTIGKEAFWGCSALSSITIPKSVISIGEHVLNYCTSLTAIAVEKSNSVFDSREDCNAIIETNDNILRYGCSSTIIPNTITEISEDAFTGSSIVSIEIPSSVKTIESGAFSGCSSLETVKVEATTPPTLETYSIFDSSPICYIPCGTLAAYQASKWAKQVGEFVEECEAEQYTRDVTPNRYGTICLPFGSTDFSGATFYEIAYKAPFMIYFDEVTKLEAGKPYIFYAHSNKLIVTSDGSRVNNPLFDNGLYGTFDEIVAAAINILTNNYIVNNNTLCLCGEYCSLSANRAYVKLDEVSSTARALSPGRKRVSMSVQGENTTTALDNISEETESITIKEGVYDILGRKMSQPAGMGFYIIDGQKVIISQ